MNAKQLELLFKLRLDGLTWKAIQVYFPVFTANALRKTFYRESKSGTALAATAPKILVFDIETLPLEVFTWGLFDQNIGLEMVKEHTSILSWSAKWLHAPESEVMYQDVRNEKNIRNDKAILKTIWSLLDEADVVLTQNGIRFDVKKLNARFIAHGMHEPSSYKHIDTLRIAKRKFAFDSNKLAYMTELLCVKYKKQDHSEFAGFKLWKECLNRNPAAFKAMEKYNKYDVLSLEELYVDHLAKWDNTIDVNWYSDDLIRRCSCGSDKFKDAGFHFTKKGKFKKTVCKVCGKEHKSSENLFSKEKRKAL